MTHTILILPRVQKQLQRLPRDPYERVRDAIRSLAQEPRPRGSVKLTGRDGWRIRVGDYRVVYEIQDDQRIVTVLDVRHRRDVYR
jgi:mRNA interferase RelE/StbE